jgi:hypothetical protein
MAFVGHANPISTDYDSLPVAPDGVTLRTCPKGQPLVECLHPHFGIVYGPKAGQAIYRANAGGDTDLAVDNAGAISVEGTTEGTDSSCST